MEGSVYTPVKIYHVLNMLKICGLFPADIMFLLWNSDLSRSAQSISALGGLLLV